MSHIVLRKILRLVKQIYNYHSDYLFCVSKHKTLIQTPIRCTQPTVCICIQGNIRSGFIFGSSLREGNKMVLKMAKII